MDVVDGNDEYILTQLINVQTLRPLIRVYRRKYDLFSSVYTEIPLGDFIDIGMYIKFINPN